jgi:hypothetical protein
LAEFSLDCALEFNNPGVGALYALLNMTPEVEDDGLEGIGGGIEDVEGEVEEEEMESMPTRLDQYLRFCR